MVIFCKVLITVICMSIQLSHEELSIPVIRKTWNLLEDRGLQRMIVKAVEVTS